MTVPSPVAGWTGRRRAMALVVGFALLYALAMLAGRATRVPPSQLALAWPAAGVTMAWFLCVRTLRERVAVVAVITVLSGVINQATGVEPVGSWLFGLVNASHGLVGAAVLVHFWPTGRGRSRSVVRDLVALAVASTAGAVVSAVSGGVVAWLRFDAALWDGMGLIGFRNALSSFVVLNALLAVPAVRRSARASVAACGLLFGGALTVTALVLSSSWPVTFAVIPALLLVALRCGPHVTSILVALQGVMVVAATVAGHGPFVAVGSVEDRVVVAQLFILVLSLVGLVVSLTEQARAEALVRSRRDRDRLQNHMEAALVAAGHLVLDVGGTVRTEAANGALVALTARPREELVGSDPRTWLVAEDATLLAEGLSRLAAGDDVGWRGQLHMAPQWGGAWVDVALARVEPSEPDVPASPEGAGGSAPERTTWLKLQMVDITAQKRAEERLAHTALHDELTGLANRTLWNDRLDQAVRGSERSGTMVAVMYVDVDHFKQINDTFGHPVGDEVLKEVARRIEALVRPQDTVARIGGDEFVVLCPEIAHLDDGHRLAERIQVSLRPPVVLPDGRHVSVSGSIGVACARADEADARLLLRRADIALYSAKEHGRARFETYTPALHAGVEASARLLIELERGHTAAEFFMVYQPILDVDTHRVEAVEALLRWNHPERGCLRPGDFLDVLENSELVHQVGDEVLRRACRDTASLNRTAGPVSVHVNISARELARPGLVDRVRAALADAGLPPALLVLEVTETRLVAVNGSLLRDLFSLRDLGVRIAVDDFGTGYSTLTHLVELPVDIVKLDASFVAEVSSSRSARAVSSGVCAMAAGIGIDVVAEGVETEEQAQALRALGYRLLQGYHLGRPRPIDEVLGDLLTAS